MSEAMRWHDARMTAEQRAYADGEYDGYWGSPQRVGTWSNTEWSAYLAGWMSGLKERLGDPTDAEIDAWVQSLADDLAGGER